ncbi:pilus assembly protein [Altererythrobacter sp. BO-6]|uniref:TadE/TadG family type IV pilus assembly protein n=1 Tax=Altererythrobacter sp. BO-6 TaxID=2604537 RepID=UPI0013E104B4|nr:TadE family protein [Altererythrobacter sp. BO-6]QIG55508.1 pilus assembly protein [Altererythrobacter sp. BO-6]
MHGFISSFARDERGMAAEFALVLPLLLIFVLGTIDIGLYAWRINQAEKATQFGARWAAVNEPLANQIASTSYVNLPFGSGVVAQGDRLPQGVFATITCDSDGCDGGNTLNQLAFDTLADRMRAVLPAIQDDDIEVIYSDSGLGFAGNPNGPDASPLITVRLRNMTFTPITLLLLDTEVSLPDFAYTLTAEDLCSAAATTPADCKI